MQYINSIDEINQYLEEDEEILWFSKEIKNLFGVIPFTVLAIIIFLLIMSIYFIIIIHIE